MLPRILERVIVNNDSAMHHDSKHMPRWDHVSPAGLDDNSILAVPNHVVLNHLTASAIKNGTLGVGTTTRYRKKVIKLSSSLKSLQLTDSTSLQCSLSLHQPICNRRVVIRAPQLLVLRILSPVAPHLASGYEN
jgi:hypothetical protein